MEHVQEIERLIQQVEESADPATRAGVRALVEAILEFHGEGLKRIVELSSETQVREFARDDVAAALLLLYNLHPDDFETRVQRAVDKLQGVELIAVSEMVVRVKSDVPRQAIEQALYAAAPDIAAVEIEGTGTPASFVPLEALFSR
ncbi:MAG TPA: hypothetical protein VG456_16165 [Candidatus Sulfopaludibacter sp.]|jgi:hypothetical protein|nr:hypothetical protein [Candidatus Sulfopaludibacter sp.]